MRIEWLDLRVTDLDEAVGFYRDVLGLAVERLEGEATVFVGWSILHLIADPAGTARDHLAFLVPANRFQDAKVWLRQRAELLSRDGQVEFPGPHGWNSNSVYFMGPSRAVLELIAHFDLPNDSGRGFGATDLLAVCEVGVAAPDVRQAAACFARAGLAVFGAPPSKEFAAIGDREGRVILAAVGRPWQPTLDLTARLNRVVIRASGPVPGHCRIAEAELTVYAEQRTS